jgi:hypothetical protein
MHWATRIHHWKLNPHGKFDATDELLMRQFFNSTACFEKCHYGDPTAGLMLASLDSGNGNIELNGDWNIEATIPHRVDAPLLLGGMGLRRSDAFNNFLQGFCDELL